MVPDLTVLVVGVTGRLGGPIIKALQKYPNLKIKGVVSTFNPPDEMKQ